MTHYALLLSLLVAFTFTACNPAPNPPLSPELERYAQVKENCESLRTTPGLLVPDRLDKECHSFLLRLEKSNQLDDKVAHFNDGKKTDKASPELIMLKTDAHRQHRKCEVEYEKLKDVLNKSSLEAIRHDSLSDVELTLKFPETEFTKAHYEYYKKQSAEYQKKPKYLAFEKEYIKELTAKGLRYLSQGDKKRALKLFRQAASLGSGEAAYLIGIIYEARHVDKAIIWHTKALERGVTSARLNLARLYLREHKPKEAQKFYLQAAEDGDAYAQYLLYTQYAKSDNPKANAQAMVWLKRSAENAFPPAEYAYGLQLLKQKRQDEAKRWLLKARADGMRDANSVLGDIAYKEKAYTEALEYLKEADTAAAKYQLAKMYELGKGVPLNYYHAYVLYKEAAKLGLKRAKRDLKRLSRLATEKEKAHYSAAQRKERQMLKQLKRRQGADPTLKNLRERERLIHIQGIVSLPLPSAQGFVVQDSEGRQFYIIDTDHRAKVRPYQYVDLTAKSTAKAVTITGEDGLPTEIYQLYFQQHCH